MSDELKSKNKGTGFIKRIIYSSMLLSLLGLNVASLTNAAIHDALFGMLSYLPYTSLADSPSKRYNTLSKKQATLKAENAQFRSRQAKMSANKKKIKTIAKRVSARTVKNVARNVSSVPLEVFPYVGVATIVGVTILDVKDACQSMHDMNSMMALMNVDDADVDVNKVCGQPVPSEKDLLAKLGVPPKKYDEMRHHLGGFMHHLEKETKTSWTNMNDAIGGTVYEVFRRFGVK